MRPSRLSQVALLLLGAVVLSGCFLGAGRWSPEGGGCVICYSSGTAEVARSLAELQVERDKLRDQVTARQAEVAEGEAALAVAQAQRAAQTAFQAQRARLVALLRAGRIDDQTGATADRLDAQATEAEAAMVAAADARAEAQARARFVATIEQLRAELDRLDR